MYLAMTETYRITSENCDILCISCTAICGEDMISDAARESAPYRRERREIIRLKIEVMIKYSEKGTR